MSAALLFALGALFAGAVADLFYKKAQGEGIDAPRLIMVQATCFTGTIVIVALFRGEFDRVAPEAWQYLLPAGLFNYLGLVTFVTSLRHGDAGVNAPIFRLGFAITAVLAIVLLGEPPTPPRLIGLTIACLAILALVNTAALARPNVRRSLRLAGLATILWGIGGLLGKAAANVGTPTIALTASQAISFYLGALLLPIVMRRFPPRPVELRWGPIIAVFQLTWSLLTFQALQTGDASIAFPVAQLGFVVTAFLAIPLFREPATPAKFTGLGLAALAVGAFAFA